jgi:hypothetical protein
VGFDPREGRKGSFFFFLSHCVQAGSYAAGAGLFFPWVKVQGRETDHSPRLRVRGTYTSTPPYVFTAWYLVTLSYVLYLPDISDTECLNFSCLCVKMEHVTILYGCFTHLNVILLVSEGYLWAVSYLTGPFVFGADGDCMRTSHNLHVNNSKCHWHGTQRVSELVLWTHTTS